MNISMGVDHITMVLARYQNSWPQDPQVTVAECLRKAQSVMSNLIMTDADLAIIQVVLGLVVLFIGTPDPRPSLGLIATAIKLAHVMKLNRQEGYYWLTPSELAQRRRVSWVAYILDRDISLRTRQPPVQHDLALDVDLPDEMGDPDGAGIGTASWSEARL